MNHLCRRHKSGKYSFLCIAVLLISFCESPVFVCNSIVCFYFYWLWLQFVSLFIGHLWAALRVVCWVLCGLWASCPSSGTLFKSYLSFAVSIPCMVLSRWLNPLTRHLLALPVSCTFTLFASKAHSYFYTQQYQHFYRCAPGGAAEMLAQELNSLLRENISARGPAQALFEVQIFYKEDVIVFFSLSYHHCIIEVWSTLVEIFSIIPFLANFLFVH